MCISYVAGYGDSYLNKRDNRQKVVTLFYCVVQRETVAKVSNYYIVHNNKQLT
jgi:hypothetical protein